MVIRRMVTGDPGDLAHFAEAVGPEHSLAPVAMPVRCRRRERELATTAIDGPHDFSGPIAWVDQNYRLGGGICQPERGTVGWLLLSGGFFLLRRVDP